MSPNDRDAHRELPRRLRRAVAHVRRETPPAGCRTHGRGRGVCFESPALPDLAFCHAALANQRAAQG